MRRHKLNLKPSFLKTNSSKGSLKHSASRLAIQERCINELIGMVITRSSSNLKFRRSDSTFASSKNLQNISPLKTPALGLGFQSSPNEDAQSVAKILTPKHKPRKMAIKRIAKMNMHLMSAENLIPRSNSCTPSKRMRFLDSRMDLKVDTSTTAVQCDSKHISEREKSEEPREENTQSVIRRAVYSKIKQLESHKPQTPDLKYRLSRYELIVPHAQNYPIDQTIRFVHSQAFSPSRIRKIDFNYPKRESVSRSRTPMYDRETMVISTINSSVNLSPRAFKNYCC